VPVGGVLRPSPIARTFFTLPSTFDRATREPQKTPEIGRYYLVDSGVEMCVIQLSVNSNADATRPMVHGRFLVFHRLVFPITRQGRAGALRWFVGRANGQDFAAAYAPVPRGLAPARDRWAVFTAGLFHAGSPPTEAACASRQAALRSTVRRAIATMHVVRNR
jgi:hypothetical protein